MRHSSAAFIAVLSMAVCTLSPLGFSQASQVPGDLTKAEAMALLRAGLQSDRKQVVATNMELTDSEAVKFWPVYDAYAAEMYKVNDRLAGLIFFYAKHRQAMPDDIGLVMAKQLTDAAKEKAKVRSNYLSKFSKVLPGKKVARFYQIENRLDVLVQAELASQIPLVK